MDRRLAAILIADVVGYSRLIRADEEGTIAALKVMRAGLIDPKIEAHHGRIVKLMGDGMLVEFSSVVDAVNAAVETQQAVSEHNADLPKDDRIEFRIGINLGDVVIDGADIQGDGVNIAARLEGLASPGGICVSGSVHEQVRDRLDVTFEDQGEQEVKNIGRPVRVWQWIQESAHSLPASFGDSAPMPLPDKPSIVVLPFDNMSRDQDQDYFSDGISEDIITDLSKVSGLFVIARNSAFVYKGKTFHVPDVCRELGVRFALEGSIRKAGNRVRVTAQLIDGSSGGHLWAERYDRELTDIFEVQDDVTQHIVGALEVTLNAAEKALIVTGGTTNVDAHDNFLKGRALMFGLKRDREMFEQSTACFRRAITLDPNYGSPCAGLGMAYVLDHNNRWSDAPENSLDKAGRLMAEAIEKDANDPFAHYGAALVAMFRKDFANWASSADRALSLSPNFALALNVRSIVYIYAGEPGKAIPDIKKAMRLDPAQQSHYMHFLGTAYFVDGDYETAAASFRDRIAINPTTDLSRAFLASALGHLNDPDEARRTWRELKKINPAYSFAEHIDRLPFRNCADAEKFADGLHKADLPE